MPNNSKEELDVFIFANCAIDVVLFKFDFVVCNAGNISNELVSLYA